VKIHIQTTFINCEATISVRYPAWLNGKNGLYQFSDSFFLNAFIIFYTEKAINIYINQHIKVIIMVIFLNNDNQILFIVSQNITIMRRAV